MADTDQTKTGNASARQGSRSGKGRPRKAMALPGITADLVDAPATVPFVAPVAEASSPVVLPVEPVTPAAIIVDEPPVSETAPTPSSSEAESIEIDAETSVEPDVFVPAIQDLPEAAPAAPVASFAEPAVSVPAPTKPLSNLFSLKDLTMDMNTNLNGFQDVISDAQAKAQAAFEKSSHALGEVSEFTKGNVEAAIESSKILASGFQDLGSTIAAEGRTAFESMTADIKELAAVKSPTDFLKVQSEIARKNFDTAVAYGSKNSEAMLKLLSDAFAPLSGRVSLAVEKARQTATV